MQKVLAKINVRGIITNARRFQAYTGAKLCAVVKANAYGHGAEKVVGALVGVADFFAVATFEEGLKIRTACAQTPVLVLTPPTTKEELERLVQGGFRVTMDRFSALVWAKAYPNAKLHIKINTGMNRYGFDPKDVSRVCEYCKKYGLQVEGIYSHFYSTKFSLMRKQASLFRQAYTECQKAFPNVIRHLSATHGCAYLETFALDMVRVGLGLYGYFPTKKAPFPLEKCMKIYAKVVRTRKHVCGGLGYGKERKRPKGFVSILRMGYADGPFRERGKNPKKICNHLCMDASFWAGKRKEEYVCVMDDAKAYALRAGTIPYEVLCFFTHRAEFTYE